MSELTVETGRRSGIQAAAPVGALLLVLAAFFAPALLTSRQFLYLDNGFIFMPMKRYIAGELASGRFPQWNPYSGLGAPIVAGAIDGVQHPFNLLFLLVPLPVAFKAWVLLSFVLAASGGYAWTRVAGLSRAGAVAAGAGFALSGFLVSQTAYVQLLSAYAALPWMFAGAHLWTVQGKPLQLLLVGAAAGLAAAAGDPQSFGLGLAAIVPYAALVVRPAGRALLGLARGAGAVAAGAVGAAPFILPVALWLPHTSRTWMLAPQEYDRFNLHPLRLLELAVPFFLEARPGEYLNRTFQVYAGNEWTNFPWAASVYVGIAVLVLAAAGVARSRTARLLVVSAAVLGWMAMGTNAGFWTLARHVPVLGGFRYGEKLVVWPALLLAVAAGIGVDAVARDDGLARRTARWAWGIAAVALGAAVVLVASPGAVASVLQVGGEREAAERLAHNLSRGTLHVAVASALLAGAVQLSLRGARARWRGLALAAVVVLDVAVAGRTAYFLSPEVPESPPPLAVALGRRAGMQRIVAPFENPNDRWPELPRWDSYFGWVRRALVSPWNVPYHVGNFQPYVGMVHARMDRFERANGMMNGMTPTLTTGLWGVSSIVVPYQVESAGQMGIAPPFRVAGVDPDLPAFLVVMPHRPRAYLARRLAEVDEPTALRFALDPGAVASDLVVVESAVPPGWQASPGEARIAADEPGRTVVETRSAGDALLVLNDALAPGWSATVDGRPVPIHAANYLVRGVWVPPGDHRVAFEYRTPGLLAGWAVLAVGAFAVVAWWLARRRGGAPGGEATGSPP